MGSTVPAESSAGVMIDCCYRSSPVRCGRVVEGGRGSEGKRGGGGSGIGSNDNDEHCGHCKCRRGE